MMLKKFAACLVAACLALGFPAAIPVAAATPQAAYYIAPEGSDATGDGTLENPWQSMEKARDAIRAVNSNMEGDITVYLRGGTYPLENTVEFTFQDSGTNGYNISYMAYPGETPVLDGGTDLSGGWTLHDGALNIWKKTNVGGEFRQLYVNDAAATLARGPNISNEATGGGYYTALSSNYPFGINASEIGDWATSGTAEFCWIGHWSFYIGRINDYVVNGPVATLHFKYPENSYDLNHHKQPIAYYYFQNAYDLMDAPGEWFHDTGADTLYYIPKPGEDLSATRVMVPTVEKLISVQGDSAANQVHNIRFQGLTLMHDNWTGPNNYGYVDLQGGSRIQTTAGGFGQGIAGDPAAGLMQPVPGMIFLVNAANIVVENSTFTQGGSTGIMECENSGNNTYIGNTFSHLASSGIVLGNASGLSQFYLLPTGQSAGDLVKNNLVYDCANDYRDAVGINALKVKYVTITHNEIHDLPYTGISIGFDWNDGGGQDCSNNIISYNKIYSCMQLLTDGGAVYTLGKMMNSSFDHNYIFNICTSPYTGGSPVSAFYLDNGSCFKSVTDNVTQNTFGFTYAHNPPNYSNGAANNYYTGSVGTPVAYLGFTAADALSGYATFINNVDCTNTGWPQAAVDIINTAGIVGGSPEGNYVPRPVAEWDFNEHSNDISGNGYNAVLGGGAAFDTSDFREGTASLLFSGGGHYASSGLVTTAMQDLSMSAWVKWSGGANSTQMVTYNGNSGANGYGMMLQNGVFQVMCGGVGYVTTNASVPVGQWCLLSAVYSNGAWSLAINGSPVTITAGGNTVPVFPTGDTYISSPAADQSFYGRIDDVKYYNYPLTFVDLAAAASLSLPGGTVDPPPPPPANPVSAVASWGFNGNADDSSGNGHTMVGVGGLAYNTADFVEGTASLRFAADGQYAESSLVSSATDNITLSAWVKWDGGPNSIQIVTYNGSSGTNGYGIILQNGVFTVLCGGAGFVSSNVSVPVGQWCWLSAVYTGGKWYLYVNGGAVGITSGINTAPLAPAGVTTVSTSAAGQGFLGSVDMVQFYEAAVPPQLSPSVAWSFNENTNAVGGSGFNASLFGGAAYNISDFAEGSASLRFSGDGQYAASSLVTSITSGFSMSAWVKWDGGPNGNQIITYNGNSGANGYGMMLQNGVFTVLCGGSGYVNTNAAIPVGQWCKLSAVYVGGTWHMYVNGSLVPITSGANTALFLPTGETSVSTPAAGQGFLGSVDDVRYYFAALDPLQVAEI